MAKKATVRGLVQRGEQWGYDFVHGGVRYTATVGTRQEAQAALDVKRGSFQNERLAREFGVTRKRGRTVTVSEFYETVYKPYRENGDGSPVTAANDGYVLKAFAATFGGRPLDSFTDADVDAFKAARRKAGVTDATVGYDLRRIRSFFALAEDRGVILRNPVRGKLIPRAAQRVYRLLEPSEEKVFFGAMPPLARDLFRLAFYCGLRRHEAVALQWKHVNLSRGELSFAQPKTGNVKTVPLIPEALAILRGRKPASVEPEAYVFSTTPGKPLSHWQWFRAWSRTLRVCKKAGLNLDGLRPHDLRHSLAQRLEDNGVGGATIAKVLGHAPRGTTAGYTSHAKPEGMRAAIQGVVGQ